MRFSQAYEQLLNGAAIRRYHWGKDQYLRMKNHQLYMYYNGIQQKVDSLKASAIVATDWQLCDDTHQSTRVPKEDLLQYLQQLNESL